MIRRLLLLLALLLSPAPALAYWEFGHETVARIALAEVRPETRAAIRRLLSRSTLLETPRCPARTIEQASVWADCVRAMGDRFSYTAPWHYQNVHICQPFDQEAACANGNCVSAQIERNAKLLADRELPVRERVQALAFLIHFVGDLHNPLHAGDRADRGGNDLRLNYGLIGGRTNLHSVWDGYLAERAITTPPPDGAGLLSGLSAGDKARLSGGSVTDWARENWAISRDIAYTSALGDPCGPLPTTRPTLTEAQTQAIVPVLRTQVAAAGLRLARLLDEALASR